MPRIFLETTIQIQRLIYDQSVRQSINDTLNGYEVLTSTYVWMEVQRTVSQDYQYLIDLLIIRKPTTLAQLMHYVGEGQNIYSARRIGRMMQIMAQIVDYFQELSIEPFEVADYLRNQRLWAIRHGFFDGVHKTIDTTVCDLVKPDYVVSKGGRMSCRRETAECALPSLLNKHNTSIQQIVMDPSQLSTLDVSAQQVLSKIANDTSLAKGERNCWPLGDLIITLECPTDALLWTTNISHFKPLCDLFGRQLYDSNNT